MSPKVRLENHYFKPEPPLLIYGGLKSSRGYLDQEHDSYVRLQKSIIPQLVIFEYHLKDSDRLFRWYGNVYDLDFRHLVSIQFSLLVHFTFVELILIIIKFLGRGYEEVVYCSEKSNLAE